MSELLRISPTLSLPIEAVTQTFAVLAKKGSGKTYLASVMAEEMLAKSGQPIVAIDPTGAWWGLRSEFPVFVFGGDHADLPLNHLAGEMIAHAIVSKRFSAVLDLSGMRKGEIARFLPDFMETLYRLNREPLHLFIDEADDSCPQRVNANEARMVGAIEDVVKRGRKRGIGCTLITQRPADLNKQVLTQCEVLFALNISHPKDIAPVMEWARVHADETEAEVMKKDLPQLERGDAWVWSPTWLKVFQRVHIRKRTSFDSGATPEVGKALAAPKRMATVDVKALGKEIAGIVEEQKANDPKVLKAEIARLQAELKRGTKDVVPTVEANKCFQNGKKEGYDLGKNDGYHLGVDQMRNLVLNGMASALQPWVLETAKSLIKDKPKTNAVIKSQVETLKKVAKHYTPPPKSNPKDGGTLGKCEMAILRVLAQYSEGCEIGKLALLSGYRVTGSFKNALSELRTQGMMTGINTGVMKITDEGLAVDDFQPLPTGAELAQYWLNNTLFGKCERAILEVLLQSSGMTIDELASATGYQVTGSFKNALSTLRTAGVLVGRNTETMNVSDELRS